MLAFDTVLFELARLFLWPVTLGVLLSFVYAVYCLGAFGSMVSVGFQHYFLQLRSKVGRRVWRRARHTPVVERCARSFYLAAGSGSSTLTGGFFLMASATETCSGLMHSSARR